MASQSDPVGPVLRKGFIGFRISPLAALGALLVAICASFALGCALSLTSCAAQKPDAAASAQDIAAVETHFLQWRRSLLANDWPQVMKGLSAPSQRWLGDIARSARMDDLRQLRDKPFEDLVFILGLRVDRRVNPQLDDRPLALLAMLFSEGSPLRRAFLHAQLGPFHVSGNRGWASLREAPNTPVFEFIREPAGWALHWQATMPLIMRGAESQSRPHGKTKLEQAIWLLRTWAGKEVYAEDLYR